MAKQLLIGNVPYRKSKALCLMDGSIKVLAYFRDDESFELFKQFAIDMGWYGE